MIVVLACAGARKKLGWSELAILGERFHILQRMAGVYGGHHSRRYQGFLAAPSWRPFAGAGALGTRFMSASAGNALTTYDAVIYLPAGVAIPSCAIRKF